MRIFYGFEGCSQIVNGVCTVGSYDGVHIGHRRLIGECVAQARRCGGESVVLTFEPHPRIVLGRSEGLKLLTLIEEKVELLSEAGVDNLVVMPFDEEFSRLKYSEFVVQYLIQKVNMRCMVVGYNHLFGHKNEGNFEHLTELSREYNFDVVELPELRGEESKISSTVIRRLIEQGDMERANSLLGYDYMVVYASELEPLKLLPPAGRYLASVDGVGCEIEFSEGGEIYPVPAKGARIEIHKRI